MPIPLSGKTRPGGRCPAKCTIRLGPAPRFVPQRCIPAPGEHERGAGVRARQSRVDRAVTKGEGPPAPVAGSASGAGLTGDNASGSLQPLVLRSDDRTSTTLPNSLRPEGVGHKAMLAGQLVPDIKPVSILNEISMKNDYTARAPLSS